MNKKYHLSRFSNDLKEELKNLEFKKHFDKEEVLASKAIKKTKLP
jgi:hypothetical protein